MNKSLLFLLLFIFSTSVFAQEVISLTGTAVNRPAAIQRLKFTSDTSYLIVISDSARDGQAFPSYGGNIVIDHRTITGNLLWRYEMKGRISITDILYNSAGKTIFCGAFEDTITTGDTSFFTSGPYDQGLLFGALNSTGTRDWITAHDTDNNEYATAVTEIPEGYIVSGITQDIIGTLAMYNKVGKKQWYKELTNVRTPSSVIYNPADNSVYLTGDCETYAQFDTINIGDPLNVGYLSFVAKFDLNGSIYWVKTSRFNTFVFANRIASNGNRLFVFEAIDTTTSQSYRFTSLSSDNVTLQSMLLPDLSVGSVAVDFDDRFAGSAFKSFGTISTVVYDSVLTKKYESSFSTNDYNAQIHTCSIKNDLMLIGGSFYSDSLTLGDKKIFASADLNKENLYIALVKNNGISTGIKELKNGVSNALLIYPNPANDKITIQSLTNEKCNVTLLDMNGKMLLSSSTETPIDISALAEGIYVIDVHSNLKQSHSYHKLVIRR